MTHLTRRGWIAPAISSALAFLTVVLPTLAVTPATQQLVIRLDGDYLRISAPHFSFLSGKPLERLKEGGSVAFIGQVSVGASPNIVDSRSVARFALSYDIWEEKFSVTKIGLDSRRTVSHLSAAATEAWCLDNLAVDRNQLPSDKQFFVSLDLRVEDPRDQNGVIGDPGINITRLIEVFSRPARGQQPRWLIPGGPYTLADLKKNELHVPRPGTRDEPSPMSLRTRLALVFIAATLVPLGLTVWVTTLLLDSSLRLSPIDQLATISRSLQKTGREYYLQACDHLKEDANAGKITSKVYFAPQSTAQPEYVVSFFDGEEKEAFATTGELGDTLVYMVRTPSGVRTWSTPLRIRMQELSQEYSTARHTVAANALGDLRRGFFATWGLLAALIWIISLAVVWLLANRFSKPIGQLTSALTSLAGGNFQIRIPTERTDEIGRATEAFNRTASQLEQNRDRLVYLTQLASWQVLARKMAHEVKNSLTPIRLTVEEMVARSQESNVDARAASNNVFLAQAADIVVDEIESLERRIRAFSEFSSEPPVCPESLDIHDLVEERIAFLKSAHPEVRYAVEIAQNTPEAVADQDLVKGILVNLLENAAEAAGAGGEILTRVQPLEDRIAIEVHDSGPGLSDLARRSLFQPTISFKKRGMGLGLSIARKSALLSGGDILLIAGELGGAGFRVLLPTQNQHALTPHPSR